MLYYVHKGIEEISTDLIFEQLFLKNMEKKIGNWVAKG